MTERYCVIEYPLGFVSVFTELSEKIPVVTLKVSFKTPEGRMEKYCVVGSL